MKRLRSSSAVALPIILIGLSATQTSSWIGTTSFSLALYGSPNCNCMFAGRRFLANKKSFASKTILMTFSSSHEDYSLGHLGSYAQELVLRNSNESESSRLSVCLVVAGGGGHAISTLAATPGASTTLLEGSVTYDRKSYQNYVGLSVLAPDFRYSSYKAAQLASEAALQRAMKYRSTVDVRLLPGCVGVACASALVSSSSPDNVQGYGHIVATKADGSRLSLNVTLAGRQEGGAARSRAEEDIFVSHLILRAIERMENLAAGHTNPLDDKGMKTDFGDCITEAWQYSNTNAQEDVAVAATKRIVAGDAKAVVLMPVYRDGKAVSFQAMCQPVLPPGSMICPGSFNPPHDGHMLLAQAATRQAMRLLHRASSHRRDLPVFMELSLMNADKPTIDPSEVSERVQHFLDLNHTPEQWGVLLTRAPLFSEKVTVLNDCVHDEPEDGSPKMSFVIGADTFVRIIDPKYYGNNFDSMILALREMREKGVHFIVGGRLQQKTDSPSFVAGYDEVHALPTDIQGMFSIIDEKEFRIDISSTEIREERKKARAP